MKEIIKSLKLLHFKGKQVLALLGLLLFLVACEEDQFSFQEPIRQVLMLEMLKQDTSLSMAVAALEKAKIAPLLSTYGPFTFFAPDNNAFKKYIKARGKIALTILQKLSLKP